MNQTHIKRTRKQNPTISYPQISTRNAFQMRQYRLKAKRWKTINQGNTNPKEDGIPILISDELDLGQKKYQKNRNIS